MYHVTTFNDEKLKAFLVESNMIEGISGYRQVEFNAMKWFMDLEYVTVADVVKLTQAFQPDAKLRDAIGMNVRVGTHVPIAGGPDVPKCLEYLLNSILTSSKGRDSLSFDVHVAYERLHPFTDGNGRSGRAIWAWIHRDLSCGFLHEFYYQTLRYHRSTIGCCKCCRCSSWHWRLSPKVRSIQN